MKLVEVDSPGVFWPKTSTDSNEVDVARVPPSLIVGFLTIKLAELKSSAKAGRTIINREMVVRNRESLVVDRLIIFLIIVQI